MSSSDPCHDCGVEPGQPHDHGCDVERCMVTGWQWIACDEDHDHGSQIWTGMFPGEAECIEFGWLRPDGGPDLNRLMQNAQGGWVVWDQQAGRWQHRLPPTVEEVGARFPQPGVVSRGQYWNVAVTPDSYDTDHIDGEYTEDPPPEVHGIFGVRFEAVTPDEQ